MGFSSNLNRQNKLMSRFISGSKARKRNIKTSDRKRLYTKAKERCEGCNKKLNYMNMSVGHNKAFSKGGVSSYANSICLCVDCNNLQGTDSFITFKKKLKGTYGKWSSQSKARVRKRNKTKRASRKVRNPYEINIPKLDIRY